MKKNDTVFQDIEILKERQRLRILQQEMKIKSEFSELAKSLTGERLRNNLQENLLGNSGLAFKLGFLAVNLITDRIRNRKRKRR